MVTVESTWNVEKQLLITRLQGTVALADVRRWIESLNQALAQIDENSRFKMIVDLHGYEFGDLAAHKEMRTVIPTTLARYGFRTALFDLFDPVDFPIQRTQGIACVAVAHVHHDAGKMAEYNQRIGRPHEHFFTEYASAEAWIQALPFDVITTMQP